jgi:hypothetical protein
VHTNNDVDIVDIDAVSRDFIVIKRGYINKHYYHNPISRGLGWPCTMVRYMKTK